MASTVIYTANEIHKPYHPHLLTFALAVFVLPVVARLPINLESKGIVGGCRASIVSYSDVVLFFLAGLLDTVV